MNIRSIALDFLGQPSLLPLRERARALHKLLVGARSRVQRVVTKGDVKGLLSIVVPMYNVERYIAECLESLLVQDYANVQVVVVDDGSPDRSYDIARKYARRDPRVQIVRQPNGGLSSARNTGARHARGEFLTFFDSDDFVDRHAYREAIEALRVSGSDFSVSPYRREKNGSFPPAAPWIRDAHRVTRLGVTLNEFPDIMVNAIVCSKVFRRSFWDENHFSFPVGVLYEDQALTMTAYAASHSFDVLSRVSINWRIRGDQSSITQQATSTRNISDHTVAVRESLSALRAHATEEIAQIRLRQILNNNLNEFLPNVRRMDDASWTQFQLFLDFLVSNVEKHTWETVDVRVKVMVGLCAHNRRDLAQRFLAEGGWERDHFAGDVEQDRMFAELPLKNELRSVLPKAAFQFSRAESRLTVVSRGLQSTDDELRLNALAYINHLRIDKENTELRAFLITPDARREELVVERDRDHWAAYGHTRRYADMSFSAINVVIPRSVFTLVGVYGLEFEMRCGELSRFAKLRVDGRTTYAVPVRLSDRLFVAAESDEEDDSWLMVREPKAILVSAAIHEQSLRLVVQSDLSLSETALIRYDDRFRLRRGRAHVIETARGLYEADMKLPAVQGGKHGAHEYSLHVLDKAGGEHPTAFAAEVFRMEASRSDVLPRLHSRTEAAGTTTIVDLDSAAVVLDARIDGDSYIIDFNDSHLPSRMSSARARVGSSEMQMVVENHGLNGRLVLPLMQDPWGLGEIGPASGPYHIVGFDDEGRKIPLYLASELVSRLPIDEDHKLARFSVRRTRRGYLHLEVKPPLRDNELGLGDRWRLVDWFTTLRAAPPRSVLFRNLYGEAAGDSALAVHRELQRRGSELELLWAVKDYSVRVPDGAKVVLEESREYYEAFGTANYLMVNVHQPHWYRKPDGQVLIETFHGYPFKMNGRRWWRKLGFSPERQESFYRRAEEWDYLVSPARYATPLLQEFYRDGANPTTEILEIGYPRNDALLDARSTELRVDTRRRLGIPPGKKAILYAPTFRDYLSSDDMSAKLVDFFDPRELQQKLGSEYVLLMRGHPFNARAGTKQSKSFINVTDYPDINHLILASDIAILDYSSLRFDYALTGKPTFYFVPDREQYFAGRESFASYEATSPGPHARTVDELVDGIRSADRVAQDFEQARKRFVATYMELEDGKATQRLVDSVFVPRGDA